MTQKECRYFLLNSLNLKSINENFSEKITKLILMNISRSKLIAVITGFISILICILYLLLITVFDFRSFLNDQITSHSANMAAICFEILHPR